MDYRCIRGKEKESDDTWWLGGEMIGDNRATGSKNQMELSTTATTTTTFVQKYSTKIKWSEKSY